VADLLPCTGTHSLVGHLRDADGPQVGPLLDAISLAVGHLRDAQQPEARQGHVHPDHPIVWVDPQALADAFLWRETRTVTAVATVSIEGHDFEVAPELARRKITVAYDPYDLGRVLVEWNGRSYGTATPLGPLPAHSKHVRAPEPPAPQAEPSERTRFHDLVRQHDEQQRLRRAGRMSFRPPSNDASAAGGESP